MRNRFGLSSTIAIIALATASCISSPETALQRLSEARSLSSDLLVQFTRAADAGNRAVMADTDDVSMASAREAEAAMQAVQKDIDALGPMLMDLRYSTEAGLLEEFGRRLAEYRTLDQTILGLAVENTNLKAQRLSFGSASQSADAFRDALDAVKGAAPATDPWRVEALAAAALVAVREIQVLQAPHIAEAADAAMTRMEEQMASSEAAARRALEALTGLVPSQSRPQLTTAGAALDRFMSVNAEIVVLSRRNSNVRSLALSLGERRVLAAKCDETLLALRDALATRGLGGTR